MHGSGTTPPVRTDGVVITMRVLFPICAVFSCGMLSCIPLLRIAIVRGRWFDWVAAWGSIPAAIAAFAVVGSLPEGDARTDMALSFVLLLGAVSAGYFLVFDIRHYARLRDIGGPHAVTGPRAPYGPYAQQAQQAPYGQQAAPQQAAPPQYGYPNPYASTPVVNPAPNPLPQQPQQQPPAQQPHPHYHHEPHDQPQHPQPQPRRVDQVRAELDELSDLLRKDQRGDQDR
ncbi:hypothetical protein AR457_20825 [Streptomyces agglomeratus]|uniref:hypothetical protein n=1 Tax=Streptomyces agglomeratus TaxID=285458 RepID=UPI0008542E88|nr:hypothetical protein [Streptomyces agglomeratus]OEJ39406.1 hypothetical protein BGK70_15830 [Streptomyces agglomeratus]OEJ46211.1 hypothetical protein AR457_20825 [Streptomyces agglomeratus]OEJ51928.1 hypothetical protein BGK72_15280 [Streptomyces agglomeratus]OEJ59330.1 hypothetical protein BGM19_16375 [Streptomyces agglomeratus]